MNHAGLALPNRRARKCRPTRRYAMATDKRLTREAGTTLIEAKSLSGTVLKTPEELANIVSLFASSDGWMNKVQLRAEGRWYERQYHGPDYDIWVISWLPGQSTGFHDHGASSGAFVVAAGCLEEHRPGERTRVIHPGKPRSFGPDYAHDVRNVSLAPAISIHAYSPPLSDMNEYELDGSRLVPRDRASRKAETVDQEWREQKWKPLDRTGALSIEQGLSAARARLRRLSPDEAMRGWSKQRRYSSIFVPKASARLRVGLRARWLLNVTCSSGGSTQLLARGCPLRPIMTSR